MWAPPVSFEASLRPAIAFSGRLRALVDTLLTLDPLSAPHHTVETLLSRTPIEATDVLPFVTLDAVRYTRNRLFENDSFELLALYWPVGAQSSIHDHGGSRCFVRMVDGSLTSAEFTIVSGGREPGPAWLRPARTQHLRTGDIDGRTPAQDIHRLTAAAGPAISLHVYAHPLKAFLVYDDDRHVCRRTQSRYDR